MAGSGVERSNTQIHAEHMQIEELGQVLVCTGNPMDLSVYSSKSRQWKWVCTHPMAVWQCCHCLLVLVHECGGPSTCARAVNH